MVYRQNFELLRRAIVNDYFTGHKIEVLPLNKLNFKNFSQKARRLVLNRNWVHFIQPKVPKLSETDRKKKSIIFKQFVPGARSYYTRKRKKLCI